MPLPRRRALSDLCIWTAPPAARYAAGVRLAVLVVAAALVAAPLGAAEIVHVNQASEAELVAIGLTASQAAQIVRYRNENGAFLQAEELLAVPQISKPVFEHIRLLVTVEDGPVPAAVVTVDAAAAKGAVALEQPRAEWQNLYGAIVYAASASAHDTGVTPLRAVRVRLELLDKDGHTVASSEGYNLSAEALSTAPDAAVTPIAAGASDPLRLSLDKTDIGKPFRSAKLTVIEVR